jgi:hypothetical protein
MADFSKHRLEVVDFVTDFASRLNDGDSVDAVTDVLVTKRDGAGWTDVSDEFGDPTGTVAGDAVEFTLGAAGTGEQDAREYQIRVRVTTTDGETLVAKPTLGVTEEADPSAP